MTRRLFRITSLAVVLALTCADSSAQGIRALTPPPMPQQLPQAWTAAPTLTLWPDEPPGSFAYAPQSLPEDWPAVFVRNVRRPQLHVFTAPRPDGRALLVVPGGAYQFVSIFNEGVELAERMLPLGITVFVLTYRLPGEGWTSRADVPLQDAQRAMRVIRSQAEKHSIDADRIAVLGFSAGGNLAATLMTDYDEHVYESVDAADALSARPQAVGLVYPVVTMDERWTHPLSRTLLLGESPDAAVVRQRSPELNVDATTPPVFIVHAMDDEAVPVENSLRLMEAMRDAGRPVEAHLLQEGGHAFGVGYDQTPSAYWVQQFDAWWKRQ